MAKTISVVTISFKDPKGLVRTMNSIQSQTISVEWIVCDGGGCDETLNILANQNLTKNWVSEKDDGIYYAMKNGLNKASNEYVIFLNSGDVFESEKSLENSINCINNEDVFYFSSRFVVGEETAYVRSPRFLKRYVWHSVPGNQQSTLYKTSSIKNIDFPVEYKLCGDYALSAMLYAGKALVGKSDLILSKFELGGRSTVKIDELCNEAADIQQNILKLPSLFIYMSRLFRTISATRTLKIFDRLSNETKT